MNRPLLSDLLTLLQTGLYGALQHVFERMRYRRWSGLMMYLYYKSLKSKVQELGDGAEEIYRLDHAQSGLDTRFKQGCALLRVAGMLDFSI